MCSFSRLWESGGDNSKLSMQIQIPKARYSRLQSFPKEEYRISMRLTMSSGLL
uniref:Uncharacterized protein n=1 Tax=Arundo donax TaxID=35708 RepID=A0A0A9EXK4_ARUDO